MSHTDGKANIQHESTVALPAATVRYGTATGINLARPLRENKSRLSGAQWIRFYVGELTGLFFIFLSMAYIFAVPAKLAGQGKLRALMFRTVKRAIDIVGAMVGIVLTFPVWVVIPILIKLSSSGSVFYTQVRVGVNRRRSSRRFHQKAGVDKRRSKNRRREDHLGRPFKVIKFRTMVHDAERLSGPVWATKNDSRITRLGLVLRKTRLDEVPQFINILKGDMSLVGPRPERPNFVRDFSGKVEDYATRLEVKPGLTGLAQVENGYDSSLSSVVDKVRFDLQYIRNWTLLSDVKIIFRTVVVVVTGRGAC